MRGKRFYGIQRIRICSCPKGVYSLADEVGQTQRTARQNSVIKGPRRRGGEVSQGGARLNCILHVKVTSELDPEGSIRPERSCASRLENKRAHVTKVIKIVNLTNSPAQNTRFWKSCFLSLSAINISNWIMLCWGKGCPVHCRVLSSISGLCPRDATTSQL